MGKRLRASVAVCALTVCLMLALTGCASSSTYQPELKSPEVSAPTIGEDGTLRVGVDAAKAPLAGMGMGSDKITGIDVDIAAAIADELGLKVSIVDVGSDPEDALATGKVDIVMGVNSSTSANGFWVSQEYLPTGVALFALSSSNASVPAAGSTPSIAAQVSSISAWAVDNEFGDDALTSTTDLDGAFSQLESGKVKYVAADAVIGLYAAHCAGLDVEVVALMAKPSGYCVGVASSNTELSTVVSEVLGNLSNDGIINVIEKRWMGSALDLSDVPLTAGVTAARTAAADANASDGTLSDANTAEGEEGSLGQESAGEGEQSVPLAQSSRSAA